VDEPGLTLRLPSTMEAIDEAIEALRGVMDAGPKGIPLTRSTRFNIEMAAREALTNAVAHGNGGREEAEIVFRAVWMTQPPRLTLTVVDEGLGFDPATDAVSEDPLSERGRGRLWIQQHAASIAMVGGEFTFSFAWEA
jgi:anti-sigma regulatory factor (Ser/Thr protein kinase)